MRKLIPALALGATFVACGSRAAPAGSATTSSGVPSSPSGQLVLVVDNRLVTRDSDGTEHEILRTAPSNVYPASPRWSPDGRRIAYVQKKLYDGRPGTDTGDDIYIVAATGGAPELLRGHTQSAQVVRGLAWTPDSSALLFGDLEPVLKDGIYGYSKRVARLDLASRQVVTVVDGGSDPSLSADGSRLAYLFGAGNSGGIGVADGDGKNSRVLSQPGAFDTLLYPRISPAGDAVVFSAGGRIGADLTPKRRTVGGLLDVFRPTRAAAHGLPMDVWRVEVATAEITRLTNLSMDDPAAAWTADGRRILVVATSGFYEVAPDGSAVNRTGDGIALGQLDVN